MESLILKECESIILELKRFSEDLLELNEPIKDDRVELFEQKIKFELPIDFKFFLKSFNSFSLGGTEVFGLGSDFKASSLDKLYDFEHNEVENKLPLHFMPFSNDGRGNHYCLDLSWLNEQKVCPVIFWQWDFNYKSTEDVETCNESFNEWVKEVMIEWTLEDYNYDGTEK